MKYIIVELCNAVFLLLLVQRLEDHMIPEALCRLAASRFLLVKRSKGTGIRLDQDGMGS